NDIFQPYRIKVMGRTTITNSYDVRGELLLRTFNESDRYERFEDYYRGSPRKITLPCSTSNGCNTINSSSSNTVVSTYEINNDGDITSVTDFKGNKVNYSYNPIGWLTKINYQAP